MRHASPKLISPPQAARELKGMSWFDLDPEELRKALPRSPEQEEAAEAERWYRQHFRWGWPRR